MFQHILRVACAGLLAGAFQAFAAPYTPGSDAHVLEKLPLKPGDPVARELRGLRFALAARPGDPGLAGALARKYFDLAMAEGDPRYIGYAEGAVRPWATGDAVPPGLRVIRALLRQYKHDFAGALSDLARALESDPANVDARSWRAAIFMVQARYREARSECMELVPHSSELFSSGCLAYVDATTGKARAAHDRLAAVLQRSPGASAESKLWNLTRLAEMARLLGEPARAEQYFRAALALGIPDNFLRAAYADYLLDEKRAAEAAALLKDWARSDTLLLRLAFAEQALGLPGAAQRIQALEDRFSESALRGEQLHLQEEARFRLYLKKDPARALRLAAENWKKQREPRDAAILLEAALAARERAAAQPALDWLEQSGFEDAGMQRSAALVKALPK
jgi:Tfp pilus assembly protein PilF